MFQPRALICPPTSPGSLGDEAAIQALTSQLVQHGFTVDILPATPDSPPWTFLAGLNRQVTYPSGGLWRVVPRLARIVRRYERAYFLGADVLDGFYEMATVKRMLLAVAIAALAGRQATIVGFSYNATPSPKSVRLFRLVPPWVEIYLREAPSLERFEQATLRKARLSADVAFLLEPAEELGPETRRALAWMSTMQAAGRRIVAFNAGGASFVAGSGQPEGKSIASTYASELNDFLHRHPDIAVILVAHDHREVVGEHALMWAIHDRLDDEVKSRAATLISESVKATEIKRVVSDVALVCGSRMHLSVAALGSGVPAVSIAYQSKFDGLYAHFGLNPPVMTLAESLVPGALSRFIEEGLSDAEDLRSRIVRELPRVRQLALTNLGSAVPRDAARQDLRS